MSGRVKRRVADGDEPGRAGVGGQPADRGEPAEERGDVGEVRAVGRVVVERRHAGARAQHEQVVAGDGEGGEHVVALGHQLGDERRRVDDGPLGPVDAAGMAVERQADEATLGRAERGLADQPVAGRRRPAATWWPRRPRRRCVQASGVAVEQVDVGLAPAPLHVDEQPAAVVRRARPPATPPCRAGR